jgi:hypothetical protein
MRLLPAGSAARDTDRHHEHNQAHARDVVSSELMFRLLVVIAAVVLGTVGYTFTRQPASAVPTSVGQVARATAAPGEQRLELTEQTLTDQLNQRLAGQPLGDTPLGPATLTHLTAQLKPEQLVTNGDAAVGSTSVPVSITSRMSVQSGRIVVDVLDATAAGLPLPDATRRSVQQTIQNQVDEEVNAMHVRVTSVTAGNGLLVITGTPNS